MNLKAIEGSIKSPKTPAALKRGLINKYGKQLGLTKAQVDIYMKASGTVRKVAKRDEFEVKYESGEFNYPEYIPKKYRSKVGMRENPTKGKALKSNPLKDVTKGELAQALAALGLVFVEGRNYGSKNPYARPEVRQALEVVAKIQGKSDYLDADFRKVLKKNPATQKGIEIYDKITAIEAIKGKDSLWPGEPFRHDFKHGGKIIGMTNGDLVIKKGKGKKLWKNFMYGPEDGTRSNPAPLNRMPGHVKAKKMHDGSYALFYTGTSNEVWPGKRWATAKSARDFYFNRLDENPAARTSWKNPKWFLGFKGKKIYGFSSKTTPTRSSHGKKFDFVQGPFDTKKEALATAQRKNP